MTITQNGGTVGPLLIRGRAPSRDARGSHHSNVSTIKQSYCTFSLKIRSNKDDDLGKLAGRGPGSKQGYYFFHPNPRPSRRKPEITAAIDSSEKQLDLYQENALRRNALLFIALSGLLSGPVLAESAPPANLQAALIFKLLPLYTNLGSDEFKIHVVGAPEIAELLKAGVGKTAGKAKLVSVTQSDLSLIHI